MREMLIVIAATLIVFLFLLLVMYIRDRRNQKKSQLHTCANCNCDRKEQMTPGHAALKVGDKS